MKYILTILFLLTTFVLQSQIKFQQDEIICNKFKSLYQEDTTNILTICTKLSKSDSLIIFFVLPVEKQNDGFKYGSALQEIKALIDSNQISNNVVFILPQFTRVPWYGNHPTDTLIWQEKYVVNLIEKNILNFSDYNFKIYLLGFSKSGWGSMSLLLNYPNIIDGIFIWDAPLSTKLNTNWRMEQVFKDNSYFENFYFLPRRVCISYQNIKEKTIVIGGYNLFQKETESFLNVMDSCNIKYFYNPNLEFKHEWNKEWIYSLFQYQKGIIKE